jgi:hypothetical protein
VVTITQEQLAPLVAAAVAAEGGCGVAAAAAPPPALAPAPPGGIMGVFGAVPRSVWVFAIIGIVQYCVQQL